jgi:hypothetical protein
MISPARGFHADSAMLPRLVDPLKSNILLNCLIPTFVWNPEQSKHKKSRSPKDKGNAMADETMQKREKYLFPSAFKWK